MRARLLEYGGLVDELHVIVFAKRALGFCEKLFHPIFSLSDERMDAIWLCSPRDHMRARAQASRRAY